MIYKDENLDYAFPRICEAILLIRENNHEMYQELKNRLIKFLEEHD